MRHLAITGIVTAAWMPSIIDGSLMRATPPSRRMSAGTRSSAITATAPASAATLACSGVTTSMITPPRNISARPRFTRAVPVARSVTASVYARTSLSSPAEFLDASQGDNRVARSHGASRGRRGWRRGCDDVDRLPRRDQGDPGAAGGDLDRLALGGDE